MKKLTALFLALACLFSLCACAGGEKENSFEASQEEIDHLEKIYEGRQVYFGEGHDHSHSGGNSDGNKTLTEWAAEMEKIDMDFASILDHNQSAHMYLDEWNGAVFIGGTEMATTISDSPATIKGMHYSMMFTDPQALNRVLSANTLYKFDPETNLCEVANYSIAGMKALIQKVKDEGGMWVQNHPMGDGGYLHSENPMDNWFADWTGIDVMCGYSGHSVGNVQTEKSYKLWTGLLANGAKVWATAISDLHNLPTTNALTAVYAKEKTAESIFENLRVGDSNPGYCGIRMTIGDVKQGSQGSFDGQKVIFSIGEFHSSILEKYNEFQVVLMDDDGEVFRTTFDHTKTNYFSYECADTANFYRVEVQNANGDIVALGNPIWRG